MVKGLAMFFGGFLAIWVGAIVLGNVFPPMENCLNLYEVEHEPDHTC